MGASLLPRGAWAAACAAGAAAWLLLPRDLPHPYGGKRVEAVSAESVARFPPLPANLTGPFAPNRVLATHAKRLFEGRVEGAESVAVAPDGTLVMLDKFGYIHRARRASGCEYALLTDGPPVYVGPGRPLGFHVVDNGSAVLVCDSLKGLVHASLDGAGGVRVLASRVTAGSGSSDDGGGGGGGRDARAEINYANDLDVADDGTVYFSSSTEGTVALHPDGFYDTMRSYLLNMFRGDRTGRLLRFTPASGRTEVVADGLWYANGVSLTHGGRSVLVVETMGFRVLEHHLDGPLAGMVTTLVDKLPGFPDGVTRSSDGNYYVCLVAPLSPPMLRLLSLRAPAVQRVLAWLSASGYLSRFVKRWGCVVKVSPSGEVLETLMDPTGERVFTVSAATEHGGQLFLGNLMGDFVSVVDLADVASSRGTGGAGGASGG